MFICFSLLLTRRKRSKVIYVVAIVPEVTFTEKQQEQTGKGAGIQGLAEVKGLFAVLKSECPQRPSYKHAGRKLEH